MTIQLYVERGRVMTWQEFVSEKPRFSIALDGFVGDATRRDPNGPYANFDHHAGADRLATRSTSEQVHMEINMGLFETFRKNGIPTANIFANDPDEDTCLAVWLLENHERVSKHAEPSINRLVYCEDRLDCTAGAYPFGDTSMRRKMAWVFEPYNAARFTERLAQMDSAGMKSIIESVGQRINKHTLGRGEELALEGHYEKIGGGDGWAFVRETGPASRMAMYNDGIEAFVALVAEQADGSRVYSIGRKSVWTRAIDNGRCYDSLNKAEAEKGNNINDNNRWNGSDTIGGSPRQTGSYLNIEETQEVICETMRRGR